VQRAELALDRVAYGAHPQAGMRGAFRSLYRWLLPFGTRSWRTQPFMTVAFFGFHLGAVLVPLFLLAHNEFLRSKIGFALPAAAPGAGRRADLGHPDRRGAASPAAHCPARGADPDHDLRLFHPAGLGGALSLPV
jgi:hypothetical protein